MRTAAARREPARSANESDPCGATPRSVPGCSRPPGRVFWESTAGGLVRGLATQRPVYRAVSPRRAVLPRRRRSTTAWSIACRPGHGHPPAPRPPVRLPSRTGSVRQSIRSAGAWKEKAGCGGRRSPGPASAAACRWAGSPAARNSPSLADFHVPAVSERDSRAGASRAWRRVSRSRVAWPAPPTRPRWPPVVPSRRPPPTARAPYRTGFAGVGPCREEIVVRCGCDVVAEAGLGGSFHTERGCQWSVYSCQFTVYSSGLSL